jgi:hypothetical protein
MNKNGIRIGGQYPRWGLVLKSRRAEANGTGGQTQKAEWGRDEPDSRVCGAGNEAKDEKNQQRRSQRGVQLDAGIITSQWVAEAHGDRAWESEKGEEDEMAELCAWEV